ncbi:MAG: hypothetical protein IJ801_08200 [Lachnospiraceae bacterium]|nr:hypothetical protein [Lachnospiraceae bacterium]
MPTNEKEYNGNLFDQLEIVEETLNLISDKESSAVQYLLKKKSYIERKLYQKPPLTDNNN